MYRKDKGRRVAPQNRDKATRKYEDWRELCEDCEILKLCSECVFGCELMEVSMEKKRRKK